MSSVFRFYTAQRYDKPRNKYCVYEDETMSDEVKMVSETKTVDAEKVLEATKTCMDYMEIRDGLHYAKCLKYEAKIKKLKAKIRGLKADVADLEFQLKSAEFAAKQKDEEHYEEMVYLQLANSRLDVDNSKLKRLLRLAMEELEKMRPCETCSYDQGSPNCKGCLYKWEHADEAESLLNGDDSDS